LDNGYQGQELMAWQQEGMALVLRLLALVQYKLALARMLKH
jgi:hypothetical protein